MATLTEIRKEIDGSVATDVRQLMTFLVTLAETNPDALRDALPKRLQTQQMVDFYADKARYLRELFHYT